MTRCHRAAGIARLCAEVRTGAAAAADGGAHVAAAQPGLPTQQRWSVLPTLSGWYARELGGAADGDAARMPWRQFGSSAAGGQALPLSSLNASHQHPALGRHLIMQVNHVSHGPRLLLQPQQLPERHVF